MPGSFEGGEKTKNFSKDQVQKAQDLIRRIRELFGWDLGAICRYVHEIEVLKKAEKAMKDIEALFHVPPKKLWIDFPGKNIDANFQKAEEYNWQPLPSENLVLIPTGLEKLRMNLEAISEVFGWDIEASAYNETDLAIIRDAKESLHALKGMM